MSKTKVKTKVSKPKVKEVPYICMTESTYLVQKFFNAPEDTTNCPKCDSTAIRRS